jgi:hypothetical protein
LERFLFLLVDSFGDFSFGGRGDLVASEFEIADCFMNFPSSRLKSDEHIL